MSLIQEALKRQQEEAKKQGTPLESATPPGQEPPVTRGTGLQVAQPVAPPPQPLPGDGAAPAEEQQSDASKGPSKGKKVLGLALKIVPIALILVGGIWWITKSMMGSRRPLPQPSSHATTPATQPPTTPATPTPVPTPQTSNTTAETPTVAPTTTEPPQNTEATSSTQAATAGTDVPATEVKPPPPPPVQWPILTVTGVVGSKEKGAAKINNVIVDVGQSIDGVKVVSLGVRSVELEYLGQRRTVRVGGSTQSQ